MSSARRGYAPLPNPTADADAERELADAFGADADSDDGSDDDESTPLQLHNAPVASSSAAEPSTSALPGASAVGFGSGA
jgi:hypothetical protein